MSDVNDRLKALDPLQSFIVQAPAGSGKTELLTQRFLTLLAHVKAPEEIFAVTFTRKAAGQMRERILQALQLAKRQQTTANTLPESTTVALARKVLARDQKYQWDLQLYPNRLRIVTIDALSAFIANRMPILSHLGGGVEIVDTPEEYYTKAIDQLLSQTTLQDNWANALSQLLLHLDNRIGFVSSLLQDLLGKRDQWLLHLNKLNPGYSLEAYLNTTLHKIVKGCLQAVHEQFDEESKAVIVSLLQFASDKVSKESAIAACNEITQFPEPSPDNIDTWLGIVELLLTKDNAWRKRITIEQGFESPSEGKNKTEKNLRKERKERMLCLIAHLSDNEILREKLSELRLLPLAKISEDQKTMLNALGALLPVLVAHLQVIFQEKSKVDFIEVNLRALQALGDELAPSDISLSLDYHIHHILIDEYQDTSNVQFHLFEKLTAGWQPGDGKTLFLVGDPMQSIYKFRGAEVSLFIKTQQQGLGNVTLNNISLQTNFRSCANIIQWTNATFAHLFPPSHDQTLGGVKYANAVAAKGMLEDRGTFFHPVFDKNATAHLVTQIISSHLTAYPEERIGVLVRAKSHLAQIILALKLLRIPFVALEIEHLANRAHVMDLMSLLRAILDLSDSVAWYAILRAPWLGLTLSDLLAIAKHNQSDIVWQALLEFEKIEGLTQDAKDRLGPFVSTMRFWLENQARRDLPTYLRGLWIALNGPQCYEQANFLSDIDKTLALIADLSQGQYLPDVEALEQRLSQLYADISPSLASGTFDTVMVELMTIHKAKGLEFDTVIVPHLQAKTIKHEQALLLWHEQVNEKGVDLLLAPYGAYGQEVDPLYRFVSHQIAKKSDYEAIRLLYVAVTRAKKSLHLIAECELDEEQQLKKGARGSFLGMLWNHLEIPSVQQMPTFRERATLLPLHLKRLPLEVALPDIVLKQLNHAKAQIDKENSVSPSEGVYRAAGKIFHRMMQNFTQHSQDVDRVCTLALKREGLSQGQLQYALSLVKQGLENMRSCPKACWITSSLHSHCKSEWQISVKTTKGIENLILDYTFVDSDDIRWIIDYKLTHHTTFNENELQVESQQYRHQLESYKRAVQLGDKRKIRCGLYFPLAKAWYEFI